MNTPGATARSPFQKLQRLSPAGHRDSRAARDHCRSASADFRRSFVLCLPCVPLHCEGHVHAAAEPVGVDDAVRRLPRHGLLHGPALGESLPRTRRRSRLRLRNFNSEKLKVNDKRGNPIEIAAAVVWRVSDTARAVLDIDHYEQYVPIQAEVGAAPPRQPVLLRPHRRRATRRSRCAPAATRSSPSSSASCRSASRRRACASRTRGSRTSPTRRKSRARCCAGSRPRR